MSDGVRGQVTMVILGFIEADAEAAANGEILWKGVSQA
jgi:hypothetical protein